MDGDFFFRKGWLLPNFATKMSSFESKNLKDFVPPQKDFVPPQNEESKGLCAAAKCLKRHKVRWGGGSALLCTSDQRKCHWRSGVVVCQHVINAGNILAGGSAMSVQGGCAGHGPAVHAGARGAVSRHRSDSR